MDPIHPDYQGACIAGVVPGLLSDSRPEWFPAPAREAERIVLFLLDGLGWADFERFRDRLPVLSSLEAVRITSVVPSSTASALTSVTTGLAPSQHGLVGYRMRVGPEILNVLGWFFPGGGEPPDPEKLQPAPGFLGRQVKVVTRSQFVKSGFSTAHMRGTRMIGWRTTSTMIEHCRRLARSHDPLVYVYYDGIDMVAHQYGLQNEFFESELIAADRLTGQLLDVMPESTVLLVASDHGQVHLERKNWTTLEPCARFVSAYAGDGRFRFLYAKDGLEKDLLRAAEDHLADMAWVFSRERLVDEEWLGPKPEPWVEDRIPHVALAAAREKVAFIDPTNPLEVNLVSSHGSMTAGEMLVPLLAGRGRSLQ